MEGVSKSVELMVKIGENRAQIIEAETEQTLGSSSMGFNGTLARNRGKNSDSV